MSTPQQAVRGYGAEHRRRVERVMEVFAEQHGCALSGREKAEQIVDRLAALPVPAPREVDEAAGLNLRYPINDVLDQWAINNPDRANLHDPDTAKEVARAVRDALAALPAPAPGTGEPVAWAVEYETEQADERYSLHFTEHDAARDAEKHDGAVVPLFTAPPAPAPVLDEEAGGER